VEQKRLEEYIDILKRNSDCYEAVKKCLKRYDSFEDRMYLAVWAPAMLEYVLWLLGQAKKEGIRRLYFLSRDAYPMFLIAEKLVQNMDMDIECRYLRVSRYSLRIPGYHLLGEESLEQIFLSGIDVSMRTILERARLTEEEMQTVCREAGYEESLGRILNRREILAWKEKFRADSKSLLSYIENHSREAFPACIGYLRQEGLLEDVRWALVDSGWVGTIQKTIRSILATERPDIRVTGFYFGLYEVPEKSEGCVYHSYYFAPRGKVHRKVNFSNCLYEIIYSEPVPMVTGYSMKTVGGTEQYEPEFSQVGSSNSAYLSRYAGILADFTEEYVKLSREHGYREMKAGGFQPVAHELYGKLMGHPSRWEAGYYGQFLFSDDICDRNVRKAANELTEQELKDLGAWSKLLIMTGLSKKVIHESAWIEGSIVNLGHNVKKNLRRAKWAKSLTCIRQSIKR
jgi:hypothetical protein